MNKTKSITVILCSHYSLPYRGIGSWTSMYNYYLERNHEVDFILCPTSNQKFLTSRYLPIRDGLLFKAQKKWGYKKKYDPYYRAIKDYLKITNHKVIIHIIDNAGFAYDLIKFLNTNNLRGRCYLQFSYHGFLPYFNLEKGSVFVNEIDEFIFLTSMSKKKYEQRYPKANFHSSVLHNGIDKQKFKSFDIESIEDKKEIVEVDSRASKCIYLWLANDRPKKGLDFILEVWVKFHEVYKDTELWVVGSEKDIRLTGVRSFGKYPNSELPKFYQKADVYLFPTQCEEGFGLSLIEALACGCFCIASDTGGVPEVLEQGQLGVLVNPFNDKEKWYHQMEKAHFLYLDNDLKNQFNLQEDQYSLERWSQELSSIFKNAKVRIIQEKETL